MPTERKKEQYPDIEQTANVNNHQMLKRKIFQPWKSTGTQVLLKELLSLENKQ